MPRIMGSGAALFDADRDGDPDLYLVQGVGADALFLASGPGRFVPGPAVPELPAYGMGVAAGDADGDGDADLFRTGYGEGLLLLGDGAGGFRPAAAGPRPEGWSASATFCDYDSDGRLDLFVTRYMDYDPEFSCFAATGEEDFCSPLEIAGLPDRLYRNLGDGRFGDAGQEAGISALAARGLGVVCHDFTGDGRPDFYVANDTEANHLWVNRGDGTFGEEAMLRGAALSGFGRPEAGMGVDLGDVDGDGDLDLLLTHFADETNTVYLREPGIGFVDGTIPLGLGSPGLRRTGFGVVLSDWDLDGRLDAVIANGRVARPAGEPPREPFFSQYAEPLLILRGGDGRFHDAGAASPALSAEAMVGRGLAAADLDGDGDLDLVLTEAGGPARILSNDSEHAGDWLRVEPVTSPRGSFDHGATVLLHTAEGVRASPANPGVSYLSSSDPAAHFGLPRGTAIREIEVRWSSGAAEGFPPPPEGVRRLRLVRGTGTPRR